MRELVIAALGRFESVGGCQFRDGSGRDALK